MPIIYPDLHKMSENGSEENPYVPVPPLFTPDQFLALCTGKDKQRGSRLMYRKRVQKCYGVGKATYTGITQEAVEWLSADDERIRVCVEGGNRNSWRQKKASLKSWLRHSSSWRHDLLLGLGNTTVPEDCRNEALLRIIADARDTIKATLVTSIQAQKRRVILTL